MCWDCNSSGVANGNDWEVKRSLFLCIQCLNTYNWMPNIISISFSCCSELCRRLNANADESKVRFRMPIIPDSFWYIYAGYFTLTCALGGISYKRPACDIFAAGASQFVPTAYNLLVLLSIRWDDACAIEAKSIVSGITIRDIKIPYRLMFYVGFLSNSPLLPIYPVLVQYTQLPLGVVNAILHLNLTLSWGMQGLCLHHFCKAMNSVKQVS